MNSVLSQGKYLLAAHLEQTDNHYQALQRQPIQTLADKWAVMAQEEFEAVFAFINLAIELTHANAPMNLIERSLYSAQQEQ